METILLLPRALYLWFSQCLMLPKRRVPTGKEARDELLETFTHKSKGENPLYMTTNNDFGRKRPTAATFTFERRARQQGFRLETCLVKTL